MVTNRIDEPPKRLRGKARKKVYSLLKTPRTGRILLNQLIAAGLPMSFQDLRHVLRDLEEQDWIRCLNREEQTGRIYVQRAQTIPALDWALIARLCRGFNRTIVLQEVALLTARGSGGWSASAIRRGLRGSTKMALGHILRTLAFLEFYELIECVGFTRKRDLRCYRATDLGMKLSEVLSEMNRTEP